ncbi:MULTISPECIES: arsenate reductase ArsC [unclassified Spirosoma]|uniref:arsenate reductase ArsC n=1 Tax=unclassified Spirosoma TaxID=2621999 RepID=UPI00095C19EE|nr:MULTISPECIES: arsenate reductase ArsC [unclassified Spirosoma]MBN8825966.1 arsenate reductase ArsC [Spirosoma sp.]OJW70997.1 MAG: protein tyrosine phosphatase [Spirosoma sp. 48-14]
MKRILVLCTGNSARSQMAEGYLRFFADQSEHTEQADVYSAGVAPHGVNPLSIQVMAEDNVDISQHTSNHVDEYLAIPFDYVITVCDNAREQCPLFPSSAETIHHSFPDPGHQPGVDALTSFRQVRDQIKVFAKDFIETRLAHH